MFDEDESAVRFVVSPALSKQDVETGKGEELNIFLAGGSVEGGGNDSGPTCEHSLHSRT